MNKNTVLLSVGVLIICVVSLFALDKHFGVSTKVISTFRKVDSVVERVDGLESQVKAIKDKVEKLKPWKEVGEVGQK